MLSPTSVKAANEAVPYRLLPGDSLAAAVGAASSCAAGRSGESAAWYSATACSACSDMRGGGGGAAATSDGPALDGPAANASAPPHSPTIHMPSSPPQRRLLRHQLKRSGTDSAVHSEAWHKERGLHAHGHAAGLHHLMFIRSFVAQSKHGVPGSWVRAAVALRCWRAAVSSTTMTQMWCWGPGTRP